MCDQCGDQGGWFMPVEKGVAEVFEPCKACHGETLVGISERLKNLEASGKGLEVEEAKTDKAVSEFREGMQSMLKQKHIIEHNQNEVVKAHYPNCKAVE